MSLVTPECLYKQEARERRAIACRHHGEQSLCIKTMSRDAADSSPSVFSECKIWKRKWKVTGNKQTEGRTQPRFYSFETNSCVSQSAVYKDENTPTQLGGPL